jgi:pyrroloquinoline quinone (PQQ) biosynthesis protein C
MTDARNIEQLMVDVQRELHRPSVEWLWAEIALLRERWDVLRHPFYRRWSAGALRPGELALYASEYDHAVLAIAVASRRAAQLAEGMLAEQLERHAAEEAEHIRLWRNFSLAAGWEVCSAWYYGEDPLPRTVECARTWAGGDERSLAGHLVTLYAIESCQPAIATAKVDGLLAHYNFIEGPGTEYFHVHAARDTDHAALAQAALDGILHREDPFALVRQAELAYRSYWELLDGLEELGPVGHGH